MFQGLARVLQCTENQVMRIVLHEVVHNKSFHIEQEHIDQARIGGHGVLIKRKMQGRNKSFPVSVPKALKFAALKVLKEAAPLSDTELLRLALVSFCKGIRDESIKRLSKSRQRSQIELAKEWGKDPINNKKKTCLTALRNAHRWAFDDAAQIAYERNQALYEKRGNFIVQEGLWYLFHNDGAGNTYLDTHAVDELIAAKERENIEAFRQELGLTPEEIREERIQDYIELGMTRIEAIECVGLEDGAEDEVELTEEEIEALLETDWLEYTPEEEAELAQGREELSNILLQAANATNMQEELTSLDYDEYVAFNSDGEIELWTEF